MSANGDLTISQLAWSDMGEYTCVADSPEGRDEVTTFVYPVMVNITQFSEKNEKHKISEVRGKYPTMRYLKLQSNTRLIYLAHITRFISVVDYWTLTHMLFT